MLKGKFTSLRSPRKRCTRCDYEWYLRAEVERNGNGKIIGVELMEPKNCPNPKCKSPYWNRVKKLYPRIR